jgi:hypothetical protein
VPVYLRRYPTVFTEDGRELRSNYLKYGIAKGDPWPASIVPYARRDEWLAAAPRPLLLLAQEARLGDLRAAARGADVREIAPGWFGAVVGGP